MSRRVQFQFRAALPDRSACRTCTMPATIEPSRLARPHSWLNTKKRSHIGLHRASPIWVDRSAGPDWPGSANPAEKRARNGIVAGRSISGRLRRPRISRVSPDRSGRDMAALPPGLGGEISGYQRNRRANLPISGGHQDQNPSFRLDRRSSLLAGPVFRSFWCMHWHIRFHTRIGVPWGAPKTRLMRGLGLLPEAFGISPSIASGLSCLADCSRGGLTGPCRGQTAISEWRRWRSSGRRA